MMRRFGILVLVACAVFALSACGEKTETAAVQSVEVASGAGGPFGALTEDDEYIFINCLRNIEFFSAHKYGWE